MTKQQKSASDAKARHKTTKTTMSRRSAVKFCGAALAGATFGGLLETAAAQESGASGQPLWRSGKVRRVVTGHNAKGRSCIISDEVITFVPGKRREVWTTGAGVAEGPLGKGPATEPRNILPSTLSTTDPPAGGTQVLLNTSPPSTGEKATAQNRLGFHRRKTIDYIMILDGELTLVTEEQEAVLHTGDICIQRNTMHGWRNDGKVPCIFFVVLHELS